jgi:hypothetical protein
MAAMDRVSRLAAQLAPAAAAATSATAATASAYQGSASRFAAGPLDEYRHRASFDWHALRQSWFGADLVAYMDKVWALLEHDPLFRQPLAELEVRTQPVPGPAYLVVAYLRCVCSCRARTRARWPFVR